MTMTKSKSGDATDRTVFAGWVPEPACAVEDNHGNNCPNNPEIWANLKSTGEEVWLCKQCYRNAMERGQLEEPNSVIYGKLDDDNGETR